MENPNMNIKKENHIFIKEVKFSNNNNNVSDYKTVLGATSILNTSSINQKEKNNINQINKYEELRELEKNEDKSKNTLDTHKIMNTTDIKRNLMDHSNQVQVHIKRNPNSIPVSGLEGPLPKLFKFDNFNIIQSKCLELLINSNLNSIISSPTGSGKTSK